MSYSSNYDKLCGNFILSSPDNLNPLRRTGPGFGSVLYFSNAYVTYFNNVNFQQSRFNFFIPNTLIENNYTFLVCSNADIGSNICFTLSNLMPNMEYSFNVYLRNTCNPGNGFLTSNSAFIATPLAPPPPRLNSVTLCNLVYYSYSGQIFDTRTQINQILCNSSLSATGGICNVLNGRGSLAIINNCNAGQDSGIAGSLAIVCGPNTNSVNFNGFNLGGFQSPGTFLTSNSSIIIGSIQDTYAGVTNLNNFYIQSSNVSIIVSCNFLRPSGSGYSYIITQTNTGGQPNINCNFGPFYVDSIVGPPFLSNIISFNDHTTQSAYVSGVLVNSNTNSYQFYFDCLNFASNFLPSWSNFASYSISFGGITSATRILDCNSLVYTTTCNLITTAPAPKIIRLSNSTPLSINVPAATVLQTSNIGTLPLLNISLTNLAGISNITYSLPYYYDTLSLSTLTGNFSNAFAPGGERIESFSNSCNNTVRPYDQSRVIVGASCNLYNFELPLVGGFYRTGANLGATFDTLGTTFKQPGGFDFYTYPTSYNGLKNETTYRVATFKYSFSNSSGGSISALEFNIHSNAPFIFITGGCNFDVNQVPFLRYKVDNVDGYNTGWLDGNSIKSSATSFISTAEAADGAPGLLSNPEQYPISGATRYWSIVPIPTTCNYDVYVKIGLKMSCNLFFDYIYLSNAFGVKPLAPSNITFTVFTTPTVMILNWSNAYRVTGDPPILCNAISVVNIIDAYYPRRWVASGTATSNDTYSTEIASNTSNVFTLVNADTKYQANISNRNTGGYGPGGTAIGKTDLPIQTLGGFYDSSFNFTNYYTSVVNPYYANCNGYSFVDRAAASNIFYNSNLFPLATNYLQVNMSPTFIVNTSNSSTGLNYPGIYLSNFTFSGYGSNNTVIKLSSYRFSNSLYSNVSLTSDSGNNNSGVTLMLSNMGDIYTGDNYFSGYFYKSALSLKLQSNYLVGSNKPYLVGFSNNYSSNILAGAPIWVDNFQSNLLPTVQNMFVDSNNLAALDGNGVPIRFTYSTGVLIFSSSLNPFTVQSNTSYDFWLQTQNIGSNFFINSPYQFSFSNNILYTYTIPFNGNSTSPFSFSLQSFINATRVIAEFPEDPSNPGNGWGTFNCLISGSQPSTTNHGNDPDTNGILVNRIGNTFNIWIPTQYSLSYFYVYATYGSSLSNFSFNPINTQFYNSATVGDTLIGGAMNSSSNTFFLFSNVQMNTQTFTTSNTGIYMFGSATNQNGSSSSVSSNLIRTVSGSNILFDDPSINVLYLTQSAFSSNYVANPGVNDNYGYRVTSGAGLYPSVFGALFSNNSNLLVGTYSNEIQLTNGLFTSRIVGNSYLDYRPYYNPIRSTYSYPNYTTVNTAQMRYTTFMWYVSSDSLGGNSAFIGQINILNNNFTTTIGSSGFATLNNTTIQYLILGSDYYTSTGWIDANSQYDLYSQGVPSYLDNGDRGGIYDAGLYPTDSTTRYILLQDSYGAGTPPFNLFFRIGIPVNSGLFFSRCKLVNISV
jgi:hypothetical protein